MMNGIMLFSYNMMYKRRHLRDFYSHLFQGRISEGYAERKEKEYASFGYTESLIHYTNSFARNLKMTTDLKLGSIILH